MPVSVGPESPTESNIGAPAAGISYWWRVIADWIKSLSPVGATQYDTDWVNITLASGFAANGVAPAVRRTGKDLEFRGMVRPDPAGNFTASVTHTVAAANGVPSGFRPPATTYLGIVGNSAPSTNGARLVINTDGSLQINMGTGVSPYYSLYGVKFKVD